MSIGATFNSKDPVQVDTTKLNELIKQIPGNRDAVVKTAAFHVLATAQKRAPVGETGLLHTNAEAVPVDGGWNVEFYQEYAGYVEMGTHNEDGSERMAAQPFLTPAVEAERQIFIERLKKDVIK